MDDPSPNPAERRVRRYYTLAPFLFWTAGLTVIWYEGYLRDGVDGGFAWVGAMVGKVAVSLLTVGRFLVLEPIIRRSRFTAYELAVAILLTDVGIAMLVTANLPLLHRVPWLGRRLLLLERHGRKTLQAKPALRRYAWVGLSAFALLPFSGPGAIGTALLGRMIGLQPWSVVLAVAVGVSALTFPLANLSHSVARRLEPYQDNPAFKIGGLVLVGIVVAILLVKAKRFEAELFEEERKDKEEETKRGLPPVPPPTSEGSAR